MKQESIRRLAEEFTRAIEASKAREKRLRTALDGIQVLCKHPRAVYLGTTHGGDLHQCPDCKLQF